MSWRRHDLLSVDPAAWAATLAARPDIADLPLIADWSRRDWPVIVRRRMAADAPDDVPAALPLPPSHGKRRVSLTLPAGSAIRRRAVSLRDAAPTAPADWQELITDLLALGDAVGVTPRVYGALLWQHMTGLPYLTTQSDLDLLWPVVTAPAALIAGLRRLDGASPVRLDGEVELPDGAAVHWRELAQAGETVVLVKTMDGVETRSAATLFAGTVSP